jgi:hypothetical protein
VAFVLILIGGVLLVKRLQTFLKSRITYPRTGYVEYKQPDVKYRRVGRLLAGLIAALAASLLAATPSALAWMPALTGLLFAGVLVYLGLRTGLPRFYALSVASLAAGVGLALSGLGDIQGLAYYYILMWLALSLSGGITLAAYLKRTAEAG